MVQGVELLTKIVDDQSLNAFRSVRQQWMADEEQPLFDFVNNYIRNYGQLPTRVVMEQNGYMMPTGLDQPFQYYLDQVSRRFLMWSARDQGTRLLSIVGNADLDSVRDVHLQLGLALSTTNTNVTITTLEHEARLVIERSDYVRLNNMLGYTTGYAPLDAITGGYQNKDVNVIVGRPGTGKTYGLLHAANSAWLDENPVMVVSLELSNIQIATRMLAIQAGLNPETFRTGEITSYMRGGLYHMIERMGEMPPYYFLEAEVRKSLDDIEAAIDRVNPAIIYIDAGYLMTTPNSKYSRSRRETVADVFESMKGAAVRSDKAFVSTLQFNRNIKTNVKKKKQDHEEDLSLESIGETDVVGQVASTVLGIHPPKRDPVSMSERIWELLKNREGGYLKFRTNYKFDPPDFSFIDIVRNDDPEAEQRELDRRSDQALQRLGWMA